MYVPKKSGPPKRFKFIIKPDICKKVIGQDNFFATKHILKIWDNKAAKGCQLNYLQYLSKNYLFDRAKNKCKNHAK